MKILNENCEWKLGMESMNESDESNLWIKSIN